MIKVLELVLILLVLTMVQMYINLLKIYTRTIIVFDKIYDVAVVDFSAYDGISMQARSKEYFIDLEKDLQEKQRRKRLLLMTYL